MGPPVFLGLAGHPVRWRLLTELARSDRQVHELTDLVGEPQNLVSYHLGRLRAEGLVSARRSAADGRVAYYALDLARCGDLLSAAGAQLHPALALVPPPCSGDAPPGAVLFLCTGNSARSQMAEALLRRARPRLTVASAGSHPKAVHPDAVRVMAERGIDMSGRRSKHLAEFAGDRFGHVVTLCDKVRLVAPDFPGGPERVHWSLPDPARAGDGLAAFARTAEELSTRIHYLLHRMEA
ncbi:arsenate reductase/protein-tyrosine-phosphatase family protein [Phytohabitans suffuscus]|uniref:ArsR family transcriptional regulator n=1 Tax=Phytohabitans suffuscus TaxID=624315 RepID=A0A6F8YXB2_9ACTN|nr:ArsR family transcriptional regulator [Phytohabitans suffuscus]BCB90777.1 ArsR family transcriptional regulator [Phytohabitans suffuscus]